MANIYYKNNGTFQQITYADVGAAAANHTHENGLPTGGLTGQLLYKTGSGNYATGWISTKTVLWYGHANTSTGTTLEDFDMSYVPIYEESTDNEISMALPDLMNTMGLTTTYGQIPITNSPVNGYSDSAVKWQRFGNVVSGYFTAKLTGSISAWNYARLGSTGKLPAPAGGWSMYWPIMLDSSSSTHAAFNLGSDGTPYLHMRGGTGASGNVFHGSFCYVCAGA